MDKSPTFSASGTPHAFWQWNSTGALNTVWRYGPGDYVVQARGVIENENSWTHLITAYGTNARCFVWLRGSVGIGISCLDPSGMPVDARFSLALGTSRVFGMPNVSWAQNVTFNDSKEPSLKSSGGIRTSGGTPAAPTFTPLSTGQYKIQFPDMISLNKSIVLVSGVDWHATGSGGCKISSWLTPPSGTGADVYVICHDWKGNLVEANNFDISNGTDH